MKFHITFVFDGNETVDAKLLKKAKENAQLKSNLVFNLMSLVNLTFELDKKDEATPESLKIGKVNDPLDE